MPSTCELRSEERLHVDAVEHIGFHVGAGGTAFLLVDEEDAFLIRAEQSTWGTFLNHNRLSPLEKYRLQDGDEIDLAPIERGGIKLKFTMLASLYSSDEEFRPIPASNQAENITDDEDYSEDITTKPTRRPFLD